MPSAWLAMYAVCGVTLFVEPQSHLPDVSWPTHAFATLPEGYVKPNEQMFVLEDGQPIAAQVEVAARWPDQSPKWVHAYASYRYRGGKPLAYELEKRPALPAEIPKSPLTVSDKPEAITIDTGVIRLTIGRPFAGVAISAGGGKPIVEGVGGPGLVDGRGIAWHAQHDDQAEIVVEQQGPAQVTVKAEGWYQTAERRVAPFCRFVTRITAFAGSGLVKFDQATIFADDMREHAIAELPFHFPVPEVQGYSSGELRGRFGDGLYATYLAQLKSDQLLVIDQAGPDEPREPNVTGKHDRSPGWFAAELSNGRLALLTKDIWQKCPKEVELARDGITYYAWPRHGALARPDADSLRPEGIYKFQCFHVGKLLDSRLPGEYIAALEAQTDTDECKADYARAANLSGVSMHNEFALAWLPRSAGSPHDDNHVAALERLYVQSPIARVSQAAVAASGVWGLVAASDASYPAQQRAVHHGMLGYARSIERYGDYGWGIYGNTHHEELMNPAEAGVPGGRPSLHRVWSNCHYQHVSTSWRLYALHGDPGLLNWARVCTDNYASIGQVRYDSMSGHLDGQGVRQSGPSVKYHYPGAFYHCKGLVPWGGRDYGMDANDVDAALTGHWPDPSGLLWSWLIDANRWCKDGYELWLANVKFPTGGSRREINTTLVHAITAYEYRPNDETLAAIKGMGAGLRSIPILAQAPGPLWEPTWLSRYHEMFPDDEEFNKFLLASADAVGVNAEAILSLALSATAYKITKDDKYLRRHAGTIARAARSVFYDPMPDKRWDWYGMGPGPPRDFHFMLQWHRFLYALKQAGIESLPPPDEPGSYLESICRYENGPDVAARGTRILVLKETPGPLSLDIQAGIMASGNIGATSLEILSPRRKSLLAVPRLPMTDAHPVYHWMFRPSGSYVSRENYSVEDAGNGLYTIVLGSNGMGAFQPLTPFPECELVRNGKVSNWPEPTWMAAKLSRGYLVPLTGGTIGLRFTAMGTRDGSYVALYDRQNKPLVAQWIRAGDSVTVRLRADARDPNGGGPWLLDAFSAHSGYFKLEVAANVEEPLLFGRNLEHIRLIRKKLGR